MWSLWNSHIRENWLPPCKINWRNLFYTELILWLSFTERKKFSGLYTINGTHSLLANIMSISCASSPFVSFKICSSPTLLQFTLSDLRKLPLQNGYPQRKINYNINDILKKSQNKLSSSVFIVPNKDLIVFLPYLGLESSRISKRLKSCVLCFEMHCFTLFITDICLFSVTRTKRESQPNDVRCKVEEPPFFTVNYRCWYLECRLRHWSQHCF